MKTFENTEIAFRSKNDADLNRAFWLFKIIGNPVIVKFGKWMTNFALSVKLPIDPIIKKTIFKQFCGGTTIQDCEQTIQQLYQNVPNKTYQKLKHRPNTYQTSIANLSTTYRKLSNTCHQTNYQTPSKTYKT
jgi:hypothetical protein